MTAESKVLGTYTVMSEEMSKVKRAKKKKKETEKG